ncbi:methylmalonyl-CoA mutase subunit beta [Maribacter sp. CXY002]|uniref:methylmalonyl-CoA mutase subunit beta n=1 Tax=Maribacter luteocoastalis TaxID=3407671 RepID=UPI003B68035C
MKGINLFSEFPEISTKAWKQKIQYDLRGADYNDTLVWESPEGIKVKPFYNIDDTKENVFATTVQNHSWLVGQTIYAGNGQMANKKAKNSVSRGVECLRFIVPNDTVDPNILLHTIDVNKTVVCLELQFVSENYVQTLKETFGPNYDALYILVDIVGNLSRSGNWYYNLNQDHGIIDRLLKLERLQYLSVDVALYQNAGANLSQQLGYAMAHANEYLEKYHDNGKLDQLKGFVFKIAVGSNYFFEIAKLRALRWLWKSVLEAYALDIPCYIIASPSKRNKTLYDYNVNMLRTTSECMSAILGGADMIVNLPYDSIYHKDNEFAERMAINQLLLLKEESHFDKVGNPADGSYYIESLTKQMAEKGLQLFKSIEMGGGFLKQLKNHTIQSKIRESANKEQEKFDALEKVLVGTNKYKSDIDKMKQELEHYPFVKIKSRKTLIEPIIEKRLAEQKEQERLKNE